MPLPAALAIGGQALGLATGLFSGLSNIFGGKKEENEAMRLMNEFEYPELNNVFEGMSLATLGGDILREDASQTSSDIIDAARQSGGRFLYGALPKVADITGNAARTAAADIDQQFARREQLKASDEQRIQGIMEGRAQEELAGIGARLNYGRQRKQQGFSDLLNTGFAAASMFGGSIEDDIKKGMPRDYIGW